MVGRLKWENEKRRGDTGEEEVKSKVGEEEEDMGWAL